MSDPTNCYLKSVEIGKNLKIISGFPFSSKYFSSESGFPLIRIRDIVNSKIETFYSGSFTDSFIVRSGDILIGMDGDFHVVKWRNIDGLLNQRILKIEVNNPNIISLGFIFYWLIPYIQIINDKTAATTVKHLSIKDIQKATGFIPRIKSQEKIASILEIIDQTIAHTEALIQKYQQIKAGLMHDLFTRGITSDGQLRPPREQAPELYKDSAIGWIPRECDCVPIDSLIESLADGPFGSNLKTEHYVIDPGVRVVRLQNIQATSYNDSDKAFISEKHANYLSRNKVLAGDILIAGLGEERYPVGRACQYPQELPPAINKADCFRMRGDTEKVDNYFLMLYLNTSKARTQTRRYEQGVTRPRINTGNMKKIYAPRPRINEQKAMSTKLLKLSEKIENEFLIKDKLNRQKSGLMHDLLTGKVPVTLSES
jgi:type I restriction enzyme, S subunit